MNVQPSILPIEAFENKLDADVSRDFETSAEKSWKEMAVDVRTCLVKVDAVMSVGLVKLI